MYVAIMKVENNRVAKYADFATYGEAAEHIVVNGAAFPNAFIQEIASAKEIRELFIDGSTVTITPIIPPTNTEIDTGQLNAVLAGEGSIVRALGLVMFEEINKLRVRSGQVAYTMDQFKTALISKMRS